MVQNKSEVCSNCGTELLKEENYCPNCGQKNTDLNISLHELIHDFAGDYFTFDSKFFRTIGPLIFKPGFVAKNFIDGKRQRYIAPLRIFIFLSFITFFLWGLAFNKDTKEKEKNNVEMLDQSASSILDSINANNTILTLNYNEDSLDTDSSANNSLSYILNKDNDAGEITDSIASDESEILRRFIYQGLRMYQAEEGSVSNYFMGNLSIVLLVLQPFFALLLKLFYFRKKSFFYIEHLVFSLYYHAFILLSTIILFILSFYLSSDYLILWLILISGLYLFLALKRFYNQSWGVSFIKSGLISFLYMAFIVPAFTIAYFVLSLYFY